MVSLSVVSILLSGDLAGARLVASFSMVYSARVEWFYACLFCALCTGSDMSRKEVILSTDHVAFRRRMQEGCMVGMF